MRRVIRATAIVAGMLIFGGVGFAQCKIAVIDMQEAVTGSNEGKAQAAKFDAKVADWTKKLDQLKAELDAAQKRQSETSAISSATVIANLKKAVDDKGTELQRNTEDAQKDVDNYRDELLGPVMMTAQSVLEMLAAEKGYSIVYDMSAQNSPIVYTNKDCDVTGEVKTRMNAKSGVAAPATTAAPAPGGRGTTAPATTPPAAGRGGTAPAGGAAPSGAGRGTTPAAPAAPK